MHGTNVKKNQIKSKDFSVTKCACLILYHRSSSARRLQDCIQLYIKMTVFCGVAPHSLVGWYHCFEEPAFRLKHKQYAPLHMRVRTYSTRSPFVNLLSDMLSLIGELLTRRQVRFTESHIVLIIFFLLVFYLFIYSWYKKSGVLYPVTQLDHFLGKLHSHFSVLLHTTLVRDCFLLSCCTVIICYLLPTVSLFKSLPAYLSPMVLYIRWQIKPKMFGYEPSITDAS